ncbi:MAG: SHOCT domain-containing protein [Ilumatobacteraceae bacterium]
MSRGNRPSPISVTIWHIVLVVSFAGVIASMTILYRSMRSVLAIGGSCASGGPYQIAVPCPDGIGELLNGSIWVGVILLFLALFATGKTGAPNVVWLLWPGLFISLGYNFLDFGLHPPDGGGTQSGFISCGVIFMIMGGGPLLFTIPLMRQGRNGRRRGSEVAERALMASTRLRNAMTPPNVVVTAMPFGAEMPRGPVSERTPSVVADLERLAAMYRSGALTSAEFESAKQQLLTGAS